MALLFRVLVAVAIAIALALPGFGDEGGEGNSGGVWVLPMCSQGPATSCQPRASLAGVPLGNELVLQVSAGCGPATATFVDEVTGVPVSLQVSGSLVRVPSSLMSALVELPSPKATIVIMDSQHRGYVIEIVANSNGTAALRAY
jgi:hypothetical protein